MKLLPTCTNLWNLGRTRANIRTWQSHRIRDGICQRTWLSNTSAPPHQRERKTRQRPEHSQKVISKLPFRKILFNRHRTSYPSWSLYIDPQPSSSTNGSIILNKLILKLERITSGKVPLLVLFVTPSWIELVNDTSTFIPNLLRRMFFNPELLPGFDVLVAVVDRIPFPHKLTPPPNQNSRCSRYDGLEGLSVSMLESETAAPDLWSPRDGPTGRQATLSFQFQPIQGRKLSQKDHPGLKSHLLQLPVANTLFQNGQTSTLFAEHWVFSSASEPDSVYIRTKKISLPQQTLCVTGLIESKDERRLHTMFRPLTPIRTVAAAMGNIIRSLHPDSDSSPDATFSASKELEVAVSKLMQTRQDPAKKIEVWALVTPHQAAEVAHMAKSQDLLTNVEHGSRLYKVLGGGGGWGAKAGILALEPDPDYSDDGNELQLDFENENAVLEKPQGFRNLVIPGDRIVFLALKKILEKKNSESETVHLGLPRSVTLGTVPPDTNRIPDRIEGSGQSYSAPKSIFIRNYFGMLTEQGMSLQVDGHRQSGGKRVGSVLHSKLNGPYINFYASDEGDDADIAKEMSPWVRYITYSPESKKKRAMAPLIRSGSKEGNRVKKDDSAVGENSIKI